MSFELMLFGLFGVGALAGGLAVVLNRDPVRGALALVASFFCLACLYLLQAAELIAVLEVLVYAGAVMVLFVFVIMLVENHADPIIREGFIGRVAAPIRVLAVALIVANMIVVLLRAPLGETATLPEGFGSARAVGREFLGNFLFHYELASVLLLVAIVGAVIISRRNPKEVEEGVR